MGPPRRRWIPWPGSRAPFFRGGCPTPAPPRRVRGVHHGARAPTATSMIHAVLAVSLRANQIVSGLALTIFAGAAGLSSYLGNIGHLGGHARLHEFKAVDLFGLGQTPILGPLVFHQNALVYASWLLVPLAMFYLYRTRPGLHVRAVGESPETADAMGVTVAAYRYVHTLIGGALAGVGGAYFS